MRKLSELYKSDTGIAYCIYCQEIFVDDIVMPGTVPCPNCMRGLLCNITEDDATAMMIRAPKKECEK